MSERFLPEGFESIETSLFGYNTFYFMTIQDVLNDINNTVTKYNELVEKAADTFVYIPENATTAAPFPIHVTISLIHTNLRDLLNKSIPVNSLQRDPRETCKK
jgi:hypothetical protein